MPVRNDVDDQRRAAMIRACIRDLHEHIRGARKTGLTVELQLAVLDGIGRDGEFNPHHAVTISRES